MLPQIRNHDSSIITLVAMTPCLLLIDPPAEGAWNMAVDEALLERAATDDRPALRFYQWAEPTLSLGYSQHYVDRGAHPATLPAPCVRRLSGGGALMHDCELTYSLSLPASYRLDGGPSALYVVVHEALVDVLAALGVRARLHGEGSAASETATSPEPFLCFARRGRHDIVLSSPGKSEPLTKIVGSAQRRSRGAVLQHGAVLLATSERAPELPGIRDITGNRLSPEQIIDPWAQRLALRLGLTLEQPATRSKSLYENAHRLNDRYSRDAWTRRR
jgi:lipoate-protein ligase A